MKTSSLQMHRWSCRLAALVLVSFVTFAHAEKLCRGNPALRAYEGQYAERTLLDALSKTRVWSRAIQATDGPYAAFSIDDNSSVDFGLFEREGADDGCLERVGNRLWVYDSGSPGGKYGPFVRIGQSNDDNAYLNFLFKGCYLDQSGEKWCLGSKVITVGSRRFPLNVFDTDTMDAPMYGTPVTVQGDAAYSWIFVPNGRGWKVYREKEDSQPQASGPERAPNSPVWKYLTPAAVKPANLQDCVSGRNTQTGSQFVPSTMHSPKSR
jgi:hypothetical protein